MRVDEPCAGSTARGWSCYLGRVPLRSAPFRRALSAFLSAAVALAALSVETPALGQKPPAGAKKKAPAKPTAKPKNGAHGGQGAPGGAGTHGGASAHGGQGAPGGAGAHGGASAHGGQGAHGGASAHGTGAHAAGTGATAAKKGEAAIEVKAVEIKLPLTRVTLDNGLRVVMNPDPTSPTVAIAVVYDVGGRDEEKGRSGFAHLFEHMMFQGSKNVKKGEHFKLVTGHGGVLNGTTSSDRTSYFEMLPSSELALGLWLEADRMASLDIDQEKLENQRAVVKEEYRMRVSNVAYVPSALRLGELVFQGYWPYEHSAIGTMVDLDAAQLDWVKDFHAKHYGPNNAVLAIAGDFEVGEATALVHKYFDKIPKIQVTSFVDSKVPEQTSQRTAVIKDEHALLPAVLYGWQAPKMREAGAYALDLAAIVLGEGESSRLHQLLVRDKAAAQGVSAHVDLRRGPSLFEIDAKLAPEAKMGDVQRLVDGVVRDLGTKGPSAEELAKAQRRAQARLVFGLQTNGARARMLAEYELYFGDAGLLGEEAGRYLAVTGDDVKKAVGEHLTVTRRTVVETYPLPEEKEDAAKKPAAAASPVAGATPVAAHAAGKKPDAKTSGDPKKKPADAKKKPDATKKPDAKKKADAKAQKVKKR